MKIWAAVAMLLANQVLAKDAFLESKQTRPLVDPTELSIDGRITSTEPRLGVPTFFWASSDRTVQSRSSEAAARHHLRRHAELYRASASALARAVVTGIHDLHDGTAVIVTFQQRRDGIRFFRDELDVIMNRDHQLIAISGYLTPATRPLGTFSLTAESAIATAWQHHTGRTFEAGALTALKHSEGGYTEWVLAGTSPRSRPVYFPLPHGVMPGWYVELDGERPFSFVVSAADGQILYTKDLTASHTYNVWADPVTYVPYPGPQGTSSAPHPAGFPDLYTPTPVLQQAVTLEHAGLSTNDPWLLPGQTESRGNNVHAYADLDWPSGYDATTDYLGVTTSPQTFSYVFDYGISPEANSSQVRVGVVQLFYTTNFLHDWFYDDGFNEPAGNGQAQNFARGGAPNDPLLAEASDFSGRNNANMSTPADGRSARMQTFVFQGWRGISDGTVDTGLVAHEWGHFISNRLIGDGNGLSSLQSAGMGEGWSDFHAGLVLAEAADAQVASNAQWQGAWSLAAWCWAPHDRDAYYFGLRRYPLSTSLLRNPLTFVHISDGAPLPTTAAIANGFLGPNAQVHNTGEVWAVMLWDCYVTLLRDPRFTFEQAQARMKRYLVAAYKATPLMPTFVEGRDALLAVAAANDPADFVAFWAAFARRGLGIGAIAPLRDGSHNGPLVEDFTVGSSVQFVEVTLDDSVTSCDSDGALDRDERGQLTVKVRNIGTASLTGAVLTVSSTTAGITFPSGASYPVPSTVGFGTATIVIPVALSGVSGSVGGDFRVAVAGASLGPSPVVSNAAFRLNFDVKPTGSRVDMVEAPVSAWIPGADPLLDTSSPFRRLKASATQHFWFGPNPVATADSWLLSPSLQVGAGPARITFSHRHDFERSGTELFDGAVLELSTDDGLTWADIGGSAYTATITTTQNRSTNPLRGRAAFTGQSARYPAFTPVVLDLGTTYANRTIRFRFRIGGNDGTVNQARGWELDEIAFEGITNAPFSGLVADPNTCSNQPPVTIVGPDLEVDESTRVVLVGSATDADGDTLTLTWMQTAGPLGVVNGSAFTTPEVSVDTVVTLQLTASDGRLTSSPLAQRLTVKNVNRPPVASAPRSLAVTAGDPVTVQGAATDSDGDALMFEWTQSSGAAVMLSAAGNTVRFVAPAVTEVEVIELTLVARDAAAASAPVVVEITINPVAAAGPTPPEPPKGCGCTSVEPGLLALALLTLLKKKSCSLSP